MQSVNGFWDMLQQFTDGNVLYAFAGIAAMAFLYYLKKKERRIAVIAVIFLIIAVYNPVSYGIFGTKLDNTAQYYRFLWIIPYTVLFAYFIYEMISRIRNKKYRMVLICVLCAGILGISIEAEELELPDNAWQIPDETLEVAEQLKSLMKENNEPSAVVLCDLYISNTIRQYDANICLPFLSYGISVLEADYDEENVFGLMAMLMYNRNDLSKETVGRIIAEKGIEYLVIDMSNSISLSYMREMGWQIASSSSSYHILQRPEFSREPLVENGMGLEEIEVAVPGLTEEYHFLFLSDLHIIVEDESVPEEDIDTVRSRLLWSSVMQGESAAGYWGGLAEILDSCNADAILLGGDMIDFCSPSNIECLREGLDHINTPYMYVRADHDYKPYYCKDITEEECARLHTDIDGDKEVQKLEFPEIYVAGLNNSTSPLSESALKSMKNLFAKEKPVILLTHVPYDSEVSSDLEDASKAAWQGRSLVWGLGDSYYKADGTTSEFLDMLYAEDSPVKEIVSGHLHFTWDGNITQNTHQHVFSPAFQKQIGVITVKGID